MRMRWQESRQVPSKPPGAGQQRLSVWTSALAQHGLYCCWTVQRSQGTSVWSWSRFSLYSCFLLVFPLVLHLFLISVSFSLHLLCIVPPSVSWTPCVFFSLSDCLRRHLLLADVGWKKGTETVKTPAERATHFSWETFFPPLLFFLLLSSVIESSDFFFSISHQGVLNLNPFLSLSVLTCSSSVRKCPLRSYLYSDVGHRNTFINLLLAIMHTKGCWYRDSLDEVAVQRAFFFLLLFLIGLITAISCHEFLGVWW